MFPAPSDQTTVHYLPGNNDVGLNTDPIEAQHARRRFTKHFGPLDQTVVIRNHTLVLLDASRLIEESYRRSPPIRDPKVPTTSFEKSLPPGLLQIPGFLRGGFEGLSFVFLSVQVTRYIRLFCLRTYPFSVPTVLGAARYASRGPFGGGLARITRVRSARMPQRSF
jgi:hypothetical protein